MGNLQIKDMPADVHAELKRRAAEAGMTQRDYVLDLLRREFSRPSKAEWLRRLQADPPTFGLDGAEAVRASRSEREEERREWFEQMTAELRGDADRGH